MKLLYCKKCNSIFSLGHKLKECECGKTKGKYIDNLNALYAGRYAKPMGIDNRDVAIKLTNLKDIKNIDIRMEKLMSKYIKCWFIEKDDCCQTFTKVKVKEIK